MKKILLAVLLLASLVLVGCGGPGDNFEIYVDPECTQVMSADHPIQCELSPDGKSQVAVVYIQNTTSKEITVGYKAAFNGRVLPGVDVRETSVNVPAKQVEPLEVVIDISSSFPESGGGIDIEFVELKN